MTNNRMPPLSTISSNIAYPIRRGCHIVVTGETQCTKNINDFVPIIQPKITKTSVVNRQHSTKTLETINHSFLTTCASTATNTCNGGNGTTISVNSVGGYQTRIEGEIVYLSLELATPKSKLNQTKIIIGDYKRQADQFDLLLEII